MGRAMDPTVTLNHLRRVEARFWSKVRKTENGCWLWTKAVDKDGYGKFQIPYLNDAGEWKQIHIRAHRAAYMLAKGELPDDVMLLHGCDDPPCCNPDHLGPGDQLQNRRQARARARTTAGERHHRAKLTQAQVDELRSLKAAGTPTKEIAERFGIAGCTVRQIAGGYYWRASL